jgi:hypothetical protein
MSKTLSQSLGQWALDRLKEQGELEKVEADAREIFEARQELKKL